MVGTRKRGKGQNMEINKCANMYRIRIFLDETGCILNEKMMPDIMVPELELDKKISKHNMSTDKRGGTRNFQILHP
jgi:hypothetical protein